MSIESRTAVEKLGFCQTAEPPSYTIDQMVEEVKRCLCWLRVLLDGQSRVLVTRPSLFLDEVEEEILRYEFEKENRSYLSPIRMYKRRGLESPHLIEKKILRLRKIGEDLRGLQDECLLQIEERLHQTRVQCTTDTDKPWKNEGKNRLPKTKVYRCYQRGYPPNFIIDIITFTRSSTVVIIIACDQQKGTRDLPKVAQGLANRKTHKGAKGGPGRERCISGGHDGKAILDIDRDYDLALHIQKTGRPKVGFHVTQANDGVEGRVESWGGGKRAKGGAGTDGSIDGGRDGVVIPGNIDSDCNPALHGNRTDVSQVNGSAKKRSESLDGLKGESVNESTFGGRDQKRGGIGGSECRDAEGEGSRSGASQDGVGESEGSLSGGSPSRDGGDGTASSGVSQGQDRNGGGSGSSDDEDEGERERRVRGDIEHGIQQDNQEEIDFSGIPETFMTIIGATTIAAVEFHNSGSISSRILGLIVTINVFGFLCCMTSMMHRHRKPRAARICGTVGAAAGGLGLLLLVSVPFSSYYCWMILGLGLLAILVISILAFSP